MPTPIPITVARGDGIGPEIMDATLRILEAGGAELAIEEIEIGEALYRRGQVAGVPPEAWDSLRRTKVFLKAPVTTPEGGGFKSVNVTVRKSLGLYANVRPCLTYFPFVPTKHPRLDVVIVRENEEDLYAGIEYRQTAEVEQTLKLISRPGSERIVRYAFEYARRYGRRKVTAFTKDNIMKRTDGLFHRVFDEIAAEYHDIEKEHWIVDIGAAKLSDTPELFDVIVLPNLYGDILSDVAAQIAGSVGLSGSANIGNEFAMFEAVHGSAPRRAGQNVANPSGLLMAAVQMLVHLGQGEAATRVHNAWLCTIEQGTHTYDVVSRECTRQQVGTREFADAVIANLGSSPHLLKPATYCCRVEEPMRLGAGPRRPTRKELVGCDVFLDWSGAEPDLLAERLRGRLPEGFELAMISNRGQKVWPGGMSESLRNVVDHWRCRFLGREQGRALAAGQVLELLHRVHEADLDIIKTENLYTFDGEPGFSADEG
jgi:isocitrate dehydrogenase